MLWTTLCGARLACWREIRVPVLPGATLMLEGVSQEHAAVCSLVLEVELANSTTVAAQVLTSQYDNLRTHAAREDLDSTKRERQSVREAGRVQG